MLKVLLADDDSARAGLLVAALTLDGALDVIVVQARELLGDAVARHAPDVVLVDMTRPDRDALEGLRLMGRSKPRPVVLFVDEDDPAFMEDAIASGVISYNVGSVAAADVKPVLRAAVLLFRAHQATRAALDAAEAALGERAVLDRAKRMLMQGRRMTEPQAHRWLQRQAMGTGQRLLEVAQGVLAAGGGGAP